MAATINNDPSLTFSASRADEWTWLVVSNRKLNVLATKRMPLSGMAVLCASEGSPASRSRAPAIGPFHHYAFELFALNTKLDVQLTTDTFESCGNVIKEIQGHSLAKAVYEGLFKRQSSVLGNWRSL